ncbi:MAG: YicC/YloC family endoribonuclease [Acidobacteriota bacterium]
MIRGMTGYGRSHRGQGGTTVSVEIRTVNHRYCEVQLRLPHFLMSAEPALKQRVISRLGRGRIDVSVRVERRQGEPMDVHLNASFVEGLLRAAETLRTDYQLPGELDVATVLGYAGSVTSRTLMETVDADCLRLVETALGEALDAVEKMRADEGRAITTDLETRLETVENLRDRIESQAQDLRPRLQERLKRRLADLLDGEPLIDSRRLEQEVAMLAERADISEELVRVAAFLSQARELVRSEDERAGRRLDFLLQELNREVNTIGSKASDAAIGSQVVQMKLELERMREQAQNVA